MISRDQQESGDLLCVLVVGHVLCYDCCCCQLSSLTLSLSALLTADPLGLQNREELGLDSEDLVSESLGDLSIILDVLVDLQDQLLYLIALVLRYVFDMFD